MTMRESEPTKSPSRRRFLIGGAVVVAGAALGGGGYALWRWRRFSNFEPNPRKLAWYLSARARWLDLEIPDAAIESWVAEHLRHHGAIERTPRGASDRLLQSLILSTDLYASDRSEAQAPTRFVSYYDPHKNPCYNPLRGA